jgi:hypothetical protein
LYFLDVTFEPINLYQKRRVEIDVIFSSVLQMLDQIPRWLNIFVTFKKLYAEICVSRNLLTLYIHIFLISDLQQFWAVHAELATDNCADKIFLIFFSKLHSANGFQVRCLYSRGM